MILATPVLAMTLVLVVADRWFGLAVFDAFRGGDPLLFQHLFWFYSHPAVYIMIRPAFGVVSEVITCFARRCVFGYPADGLFDAGHRDHRLRRLGHHMFVSGQSVFANLVFSFLSFDRRRAVGDQSVQLDGDPLSRADHIRGADALRARVRRPVHSRRPDRPLPRLDFDRRAGDRHLLRHRTFPLRHGWWWPISLAGTSGGRRSPGGVIRNPGRASRRS